MAVDQIRRLYESMPGKLDRARRRFGRALTLTEKILVEPDRASIDGLAARRPGRPIDVLIGKPGRRSVTTHGNHTMTDEHIGWFRAGSALHRLK